jgi:hypothetical protein
MKSDNNNRMITLTDDQIFGKFAEKVELNLKTSFLIFIIHPFVVLKETF